MPWLAPISAWLENEAILGYVLMTPALLLIVVFIAYPFSLGVWLSLTDKLVGKPAHFIGLRNFTHLFESQIFWGTVWNTVFFTFSATVLKAVLGMWLAVLLNRKIRLARFIRASVLLPFIVPTVLSGLAIQQQSPSNTARHVALDLLFGHPADEHRRLAPFGGQRIAGFGEGRVLDREADGAARTVFDELDRAIGGQAGADMLAEGGADLVGVLVEHQPEGDFC